jgi:Homeodomain-like domain-containing protein
MRSGPEVIAAQELAATGATASAVARELGLPRSTVRDWLAGRLPHSTKPADGNCGEVHVVDELSPEYVYLLGLYLGDGCISHHPRGVYKLRIFLDAKYPEIISRAARAIEATRGRGPRTFTRDNCVEVFSFWRHWRCLFPQHGPGKKHERVIALVPWQQELVDRWPEDLIRGLIQSDGCRFQNSGRGGWSHPRYSFTNHSADIHSIFRGTCERIGARWTAAGPYTTYVSRKADVARLDQFIGPKR